MKRKLIVAFVAIIITAATAATVFAENNKTVKVWRDPLLKRYNIRKIFVSPLTIDLNTDANTLSESEFEKYYYDWIIRGIRATKQGKKLSIKTLPEVERELEIVYGEKTPSMEILLERAYARGYEAFIYVSLTQEFNTEVIPEHTETRTVLDYDDIDYYNYKNDKTGKIPNYYVPKTTKYETVTIPEQRIKYLSTTCSPKLYLLDQYIPDAKAGNYEGNCNASVDYKIYRQYQGGDVTKVLENITIASMKSLLTGKKH